MSKYKVSIRRVARKKIRERADYIAAESGSTKIAQDYAKGIRKLCESLSDFPHRNIQRNDLFPNLRITNYKGTSIVAYLVDDEKKVVHVMDVFHSSQDDTSLF